MDLVAPAGATNPLALCLSRVLLAVSTDCKVRLIECALPEGALIEAHGRTSGINTEMLCK